MEPTRPMFAQLDHINARPAVFGAYTAASLWTDPYRAQQMLAYHLNDSIDASSRSSDFIDASVAWMVEQFHLGPGRAVCDFGCGPGLYTSRLAASGATVTGLDFSANSIRYARAQAEKSGQLITYHHTNYLEFVPDQPFDLITMIMCDFCALSPAQRRRLLGIFRDALTDDGAILLDVYSMAAFAAQSEAQVYEKNQLNQFWSEQDYYCFVNKFKYEAEAVLLDKYSIFLADGTQEVVYNWLQHFSPDSLTAEVRDSGFEVQQVYGDVVGAPYAEASHEFAIVARKA